MTTSTLLMQGQALALSNTMRMPLVLILSKRRMRFLLGHSRIPLRHLHILVTEHLADGLLFHKHIESLLDGKQQLLDVLVGFHGFLALALQSAGTRIPKRWSARQLAGELRHSPVHRDASHDGSFSILVHSALF